MQSGKHYLWCAIGFLISGLNPLYWSALKAIPSEEILYHRCIWTAITLASAIALQAGENRQLLKNWRRDFFILGLSTICLGSNWFGYIWAINHGFILDASIAYFISPIISMLLSLVILHEQQTRKQWIAIACCILGVVSHTIYSGHIPTLALIIALSYSIYGLLTKFLKTPPLQRMLFESLLGSGFVSIFLHKTCSIAKLSTYEGTPWWMIAASGLITALPGFLFIQSARKLPYSTVGIMNYIVPSTLFLLSIFHFGEMLSYSKLFMVLCVWIGIVLYFRSLQQMSKA